MDLCPHSMDLLPHSVDLLPHSVDLSPYSLDLRTKEVVTSNTMWNYTCLHSIFTVLKNDIFFLCTEQRNVYRVTSTQSCVWLGRCIHNQTEDIVKQKRTICSLVGECVQNQWELLLKRLHVLWCTRPSLATTKNTSTRTLINGHTCTCNLKTTTPILCILPSFGWLERLLSFCLM